MVSSPEPEQPGGAVVAGFGELVEERQTQPAVEAEQARAEAGPRVLWRDERSADAHAEEAVDLSRPSQRARVGESTARARWAVQRRWAAAGWGAPARQRPPRRGVGGAPCPGPAC